MSYSTFNTTEEVTAVRERHITNDHTRIDSTHHLMNIQVQGI